MGLGQSLLEERTVGEAGERIVKRLVFELRREGSLFGDVALGEHEVQDLAVGVTRWRT